MSDVLTLIPLVTSLETKGGELATEPLIKMAVNSGGRQISSTDSGLRNVRAMWYLCLWYFFSGCTFFLNKYIMISLGRGPTLLECCQMLTTLVGGYILMNMGKVSPRTKKPEGFYWQMMIVGGLRFATVLLGLLALNNMRSVSPRP